MNTTTGEILDRHRMTVREFEQKVREAEERGEEIVPVSEKVATQQRAGQIAMSRAERRTKRRASNNRKKR